MIFKSVAKVCTMLGLVASVSFMSVSQAQDLPLQGVKLEVGVAPTAPFVVVGASLQEITGIDIDIIKELQRRTGFELANDRLHLANFSDLVEMGSTGQLDIATGAFTLSEERGKIFHQSVPTFRSHTVLVTNGSKGIKTINDMSGRTMANIAGAKFPVQFDPNVERNMKIENEHSVFMTFYAVYKGDADAMLIDAPMAHDAINTWGKGRLQIADDIEGTDSDIGMMFKKDSKYSYILNEYLDQMRADGTVEKIIHKYLPGYKLPPELQPYNVRLSRATGANATAVAINTKQ